MTALAHELAGLKGPLHGLVSEFQRWRKKIERRSISITQTTALPVENSTKRRAENDRGAQAPLQGRAYAALAPASQS